MGNASRHCFCAFCKSERVVYNKRHGSWTDVGLAALASFVLMLALWQDFDPKVFGLFAVFFGFTEMFVQLRWRLSLPCPHCAFDPILYRRDPNRAAEKVSAFLQRRREDPAMILTKLPNLPVLVKKKSRFPQAAAAKLPINSPSTQGKVADAKPRAQLPKDVKSPIPPL